MNNKIQEIRNRLPESKKILEKHGLPMTSAVNDREYLLSEYDRLTEEQQAALALYESEARHSSDLLHDLLKYKKAVKEVVRLYEHGNMETDFGQVLEGMYEVCKDVLMDGDKE